MEYRIIADDGGAATYALIFDKGDEAASELMRFAKETGVTGASITGVGGASRTVVGWYDFSKKAFEPTVIDEQCEVVSILGDIATKEDGEPQVHAHIVVAKRGAHAFGGHLMEMIINPTAEVVVTETPTHLHKRSVPDYHFATIRLNEST